MSVLRQHTVLLDVAEPVPGPFVGSTFQFTPNDGDSIADAGHEFAALVHLLRGPDPARVLAEADAAEEPSGTVPPPEPEAQATGPSLLLSIDGSFGDGRWIRLGGASLGTRDRRIEKVVPLGPMPPILRVRVTSPRNLKFTFAAYVAIGSSAPYKSRLLS